MKNNVEGLAEVLRALESMGKDIDSKQIESVTRNEAQKIVNAAKSMMPEQTGLAKQSVQVISTKTENGFTGTLAGINWHAEHGYLAHIFEIGTRPRFTKSGKSTGEIAPMGFMRRAIDMNAKSTAENISNQLTKIIKDLAKKNNLQTK
jgi:HK97 gp10 family phage protein